MCASLDAKTGLGVLGSRLSGLKVEGLITHRTRKMQMGVAQSRDEGIPRVQEGIVSMGAHLKEAPV